MKRLALCIIAAALLAPVSAHAHARHHHHGHIARVHRVEHYAGGRPAAWCGWYELQKHPQAGGRELYLARNWARVGHPTSPHVGVIVVWSHHVGEIVGGSPGAWVINSGNDGHQVRTRPRSVAGAIAFREL